VLKVTGTTSIIGTLRHTMGKTRATCIWIVPQWDKYSFKGSLSTFECHSVILKIITNYEKGTVCTARKDWLRQGSTQF
jgi:hypothetical protein